MQENKKRSNVFGETRFAWQKTFAYMVLFVVIPWEILFLKMLFDLFNLYYVNNG